VEDITGASAAVGAGPGAAAIKHVIVLVLENRSFDHLLGYLQHPRPADFDGVLGPDGITPKEGLGNYLLATDPTSPWCPPKPEAGYTVPEDPDHSHYAVMGQIQRVRRVNNAGFVHSYAHKAAGTEQAETLRRIVRTWARRIGLVALLLAAILAVVAHWISAVVLGVGAVLVVGLAWFLTRPRPVPAALAEHANAIAAQIMFGFKPEHVGVLSRLATEFAVCTRWFCSLPGETWPNRDFVHAATSAGSVNIEYGRYRNPTIFERLDKANKAWRVYYGQFPPQVYFFDYVLERSVECSAPLEQLFTDIDQDRLPNYSFVEPHHGLLGQQPSCSQHPGNNVAPGHDGSDFRRGERLIGEIYQGLLARPDLFRKTMFVVTYDEHGGNYDHVPPPATVAPGGKRMESFTRRLMRWVIPRDYQEGFGFRRLGPRVPAIVVSPWIPPATIDHRVHDHASIPATLRKLFAPRGRPLTARDKRASTFDDLLTLEQARSDGDLPSLNDEMSRLSDVSSFAAVSSPPASPLTRFEWQLLSLTDAIRRGTLGVRAQFSEKQEQVQPGRPMPSIPKRQRLGPLRQRRLRTMTTQQLDQLHRTTHFYLSVIAAERASRAGNS
jgi:phospholipase C